MELSPLLCKHDEDETKRVSLDSYFHRECVKGHVQHDSSPGISSRAATGSRRVARLEDRCPVCSKK